MIISQNVTSALPDYPELYNPLATYNYHLQLSSWSSIVGGGSATGRFWAEGDTLGQVNVLVTGKSSSLVGREKISVKISFSQTSWHGMTQLYLENGDDRGVMSEGVAWLFFRMANPVFIEGTDFDFNWHPLAHWVSLYVNGRYIGVYTSVEPVDQTFLEHRGLFVPDHTWLYKKSKGNREDTRIVGNQPDSPRYDELCYPPFRSACRGPSDDALYADMNSKVRMKQMLAFGAVESLVSNTDGLFTHDKNFQFVDWDHHPSFRRYFIVWDLDLAFSAGGPASGGFVPVFNIYKGRKSSYRTAILSHPCYRQTYNNFFGRLHQAELSPNKVCEVLNQLENSPVLAAIKADPLRNQMVNADGGQFSAPLSDSFLEFCTYIESRWQNVLQQIEANQSPPRTSMVDCDPSAE